MPMNYDTLNTLAGLIVCTASILLAGCDSSDDDAETGVPVAQNQTIAQNASFTVSAQANVFAAGLAGLPSMNGGAGRLPPSFGFDAGPGKILTVTAASGLVNCCASTQPADPPDGGNGGNGGTVLQAFEDLSGVVIPDKFMFISAVFTNDRDSGKAAPVALNYNDLDLDNTVEFFPLLNQVFFMGDGMTVDGTTQSFYVPESATSVSFGVADGVNGNPGYYDDNTGEWRLSVRLE